jgi:hypothetical protein
LGTKPIPHNHEKTRVFLGIALPLISLKKLSIVLSILLNLYFLHLGEKVQVYTPLGTDFLFNPAHNTNQNTDILTLTE